MSNFWTITGKLSVNKNLKDGPGGKRFKCSILNDSGKLFTFYSTSNCQLGEKIERNDQRTVIVDLKRWCGRIVLNDIKGA